MPGNSEEIWEPISSDETECVRELLSDQLKNPSADTCYLASQVALNTSRQIQFLKKSVQLDSFHQQAAATLANVNAPEKPVQSVQSTPQPKVNEISALIQDEVRSESGPSASPQYHRRRLVPFLTAGVLGTTQFVISDSSQQAVLTIAT
jgi:hypothetical protein